MLRSEIIFTGRVQGVGFRYTACRVAERFDVSGWVRNEPDGSVRCVVEGEAGEIERFLASLRDAMADHIEDMKSTPAAATGEFAGFTIRR